MTFAELHAESKANNFPDGLPSNLRNQYRNAVTDALIAAQKYCKTVDGEESYYQQRHIDRFPFCSTYFNCGATVVPAPNGRVLEVYTVVDGLECCRVDYTPVANFAEFRQWIARWTETWTEPPNTGLPTLQPGFKFSEAVTDKALGRAGYGHYFIHNRKIFIAPRIESDEIVVVEWAGLKQSFDDADIVTEDADRELTRFIELYAAHEIWSRFMQDTQQAGIFFAKQREAMIELISSAQDKLLANQRKPAFPSPRSVGGCGCVSKECRVVAPASEFGGVAAASNEHVIGFTADIQGDGEESLEEEQSVETLITGWTPDAIVFGGDLREGDNTYQQMFEDMAGYAGYLARTDAATNRLWPVLGNHDWTDGGGLLEWYSYFQMLPNNQRYYEFVVGAVHFFSLSGYASEPDGITSTSPQAEWLRLKLAASKAKWKVVLLHQPPYSSKAGYDGSVYQWPFKLWGADLLLTGHIHAYERLLENGLPIITCGLGGEEPLVTLGAPIAGSLFQHDTTHGAVRMVAGCDRLVCEFYPVGTTTPIDTLTLTKP